MSRPADDAQRDLERRALRNVRQLVEKLEQSDEVDARSQKRMLLAIIAGAVLLALAIAIAIFLAGDRPAPIQIDPAKLPPVRAGPPR